MMQGDVSGFNQVNQEKTEKKKPLLHRLPLSSGPPASSLYGTSDHLVPANQRARRTRNSSRCSRCRGEQGGGRLRLNPSHRRGHTLSAFHLRGDQPCMGLALCGQVRGSIVICRWLGTTRCCNYASAAASSCWVLQAISCVLHNSASVNKWASSAYGNHQRKLRLLIYLFGKYY